MQNSLERTPAVDVKLIYPSPRGFTSFDATTPHRDHRPRQRWARRSNRPKEPKPVLSARATAVLLRQRLRQGCPSEEIRTLAKRKPASGLLRIAERCTTAELLATRGVGRTIVAEIEAWLAAHGKRFRPEPPSPKEALMQALDHIEALLEGSDGDAYLAAYVALPELRRSLTHPAKLARNAVCRGAAPDGPGAR